MMPTLTLEDFEQVERYVLSATIFAGDPDIRCRTLAENTASQTPAVFQLSTDTSPSAASVTTPPFSRISTSRPHIAASSSMPAHAVSSSAPPFVHRDNVDHDAPPPYARASHAGPPLAAQHMQSYHTLTQPPTPGFTINYYILPNSPAASQVRHPVASPSPQHRAATDDVMNALLRVFNELEIDQRSQQLIIGGLGAPAHSVNWQSLLINSSSVNPEHHPLLLQILGWVEGADDVS